MGQSIGVLQAVRTTLEGMVTTEARIAGTAALLLAGVFVLLITPWLIDRLSRLLSRWLFERDRVPVDTEDVSWLVPTRAAVRTVQLGVFLLVGLALLVVWGYVVLAARLVDGLVGVLPTLGRVLVTLALLGGALVGTNVLESWVDSYVEGSDRINQHQQEIVFRVLQIVLLLAAGLAVLTVWQFNLGGLLVGAGFLGIVVGMAARQTLGSLIAGFVLMFSRPFELGDWVLVDDQEGIVTDITIIDTRIRNFDGEIVVIPNDRVGNSTIVNRTERGRLRIRVDVGVDYDADLERAESVALGAIESVDNVLDVPSPQVIPKAFGDSAVVLETRFWIDNPTARGRWRAQADVVRAVKAAFDREGIKIPFPQRELAGRTEEGGFRVAGASTADGSAADDSTADGRPTGPDAPREN